MFMKKAKKPVGTFKDIMLISMESFSIKLIL